MEVSEAIRIRRSVRAYATKEIPPEIMTQMQEVLRLAPSACNIQPWHFVVVTDADVRRELAQAANGQKWMADAPVIVVGCGFPEQAYKRMGAQGNSVDIDVAIALDHLSLAAVTEGLGTCWIGAFNETQVKALLNIPRDAKVVAMMPLGYPASPDLNRPMDPGRRKAESEVFSTNRYGNSAAT